MAKASFYAVQQGRKTGVFRTWDECKQQVDHFPGARYKKFSSNEEAEAFVRGEAAPASSSLAASSSSLKRPREEQASPKQLVKSAGAAPLLKASGSIARRRLAPSPTQPLAESEETDDGVRVIEVYTDGASSHNGQKGAAAGYGVYWPEGDGNQTSDVHGLNVSERLDGELQTNNRAELMALIKAVQLCPDKDAKLTLYTDSQYAINAITVWQHAWRRNKWQRRPAKAGSGASPVLNKDLIRRLEHEMASRLHRPKLVYVKGHNRNHGNEMADRLAVAGAAKAAIPRDMWVEHEPPVSDDEGSGGDRKRQRTVIDLWTKAGVSVEKAREKAGILLPQAEEKVAAAEAEQDKDVLNVAEEDDGGVDWDQVEV